MKSNEYEKRVINSLSSDAYWSVNKALARKVGIEESVLIAELIYKFKYWRALGKLDNKRGFFYTSNDIQKVMPVSVRAVKRLTKSVIKSGAVKVKKRGNPAKNYWYLQWEFIDNVLTSESETEPTGQYDSEPASENETELAITKKSDQENNTNDATAWAPRPFNDSSTNKANVSRETIDIVKPVYAILEASAYKVERSKNLTTKIAKAIKNHGVESVCKATMGKIDFMRKEGKPLYFHSFIEDAEAIKWHADRYKDESSGWNAPQPAQIDPDELVKELAAV